MNQDSKTKVVSTLFFNDHPLHLLKYNGEIVLLTQKIGQILEIAKPLNSLTTSKTLEEDEDYATIPAVSLGEWQKDLQPIGNHVSILYLTGFFLFTLKLNKPQSVPLIRLVVVALTNLISIPTESPEITEIDLKLLEIEAYAESGFARKLLIERGFQEADSQNKPKGGNHEN